MKYNSPEELLAKLRPDIDGVVLRLGGHQGLFLPQVWKLIPDKQQFFGRLAEEKAGPGAGRRGAQRRNDSLFQVEAFAERKAVGHASAA